MSATLLACAACGLEDLPEHEPCPRCGASPYDPVTRPAARFARAKLPDTLGEAPKPPFSFAPLLASGASVWTALASFGDTSELTVAGFGTAAMLLWALSRSKKSRAGWLFAVSFSFFMILVGLVFTLDTYNDAEQRVGSLATLAAALTLRAAWRRRRWVTSRGGRALEARLRPFKRAEPFGGIFGRRRNALIEFNNRVAAAGCVARVSPDAVAKIEKEHGISFAKHFPRASLILYARYLRHFLADDRLSGEEKADLAALEARLGIPADRTKSVRQELGRWLVEQRAREAMAQRADDGYARQYLQEIAKDLDLVESEVRRSLTSAGKAPTAAAATPMKKRAEEKRLEWARASVPSDSASSPNVTEVETDEAEAEAPSSSSIVVPAHVWARTAASAPDEEADEDEEVEEIDFEDEEDDAVEDAEYELEPVPAFAEKSAPIPVVAIRVSPPAPAAPAVTPVFAPAPPSRPGARMRLTPPPRPVAPARPRLAPRERPAPPPRPQRRDRPTPGA